MRLNLLLPAVAVGIAGTTVLAAVSLERPGWADLPEIARFLLPVLWLGVAGWLTRQDRTPTRHATSCAAVFVMVVTLPVMANVAARHVIGRSLQHPAWLNHLLAHSLYLTGPALLTAVAPAAIGWWQRRRDRQAEGDD